MTEQPPSGAAPSPAAPAPEPNTAAQMLGVDGPTLSRWARQGKFTRITIPSGHSRFMESEVLAMRNTLIDGAS